MQATSYFHNLIIKIFFQVSVHIFQTAAAFNSTNDMFNNDPNTRNPAVFFFYENWKNEAELDKHMNTAHFQALVAAVGGITEEITINKVTRLDKG